jgi:endonuclease/exonuclease/phosphatase (EEP) superfamily protein YafD
MIGVIAVHNPRDNGQLSAMNNRRILAAVNTIQSYQIPVLVAGDFNSGRPTVCRYTRHPHAMESARHRRANPCRRGGEAPIDQAFATPDLNLKKYRAMPSRATDHHYVYAVTFQPRPPR